MLAGISGLIGLIIFVAIAIISSLFKRKQEDEFELPPELKPRRNKPPRTESAPARNWEKQLRQLLEERPAPPPIVQEMPPPTATWEASPPPVFAPPARTRPVIRAAPPEEPEPHIEVSLRTPHPNVEPSFQPLPGLTDSGVRYADASHLQQRVAQHLADVTRHRVGTTSATRHDITREVQEVITSIRNPETVRKAMLASIILSPPRALEV